LIGSIYEPFPEDNCTEMLVVQANLVESRISEEYLLIMLPVKHSKEYDWQSSEDEVVHLINNGFIYGLA
jgi:hypothetical protein